MESRFLLCDICAKQYDEPRLLNCLHTFCLSCLNSRLSRETNEGRKLTCPTCNTQVNIEGSCQSLKENVLFNRLKDLEEIDDEEGETYDPAEVEHLINTTEEKKSEVKAQLGQIRRKYDEKSETLEKRKLKIDTVKLQTSNKIKSFFNDLRNRLNDHLTTIENNVQDEVSQIVESEAEVISLENTWVDSLKSLWTDWTQFMDNFSVSSGPHATVALDALEEMKSLCNIFEGKLSQINNVEFCVDFTSRDDEIQSLFRTDLTNLQSKNTSTYRIDKDIESADDEDDHDASGTVTGRDVEPSAPELPENCDTRNPTMATYIRTFRTTVRNDRTIGYISGICWLDDKHLVLIDRSNQCIKICNVDGVVGSVQMIAGIVADIIPTKVKQMVHNFVLALPEQSLLMQIGVVQIGRVTHDLMPYIKPEIRQIRTQIGYTCLAYDKEYSKLVCCVSPPFGHPRIDIVNGDGSVFRTFVWSNILEEPRAIVISENGVMVVVDQKRKCLVFISTYGEFLGLYKGARGEPLRDPAGLALDYNQNVYVTDTESNAIDIVRLDRTRLCRIQSDVDLGMPREMGLLGSGFEPKLAIHAVSYGNEYISVYKITVPDIWRQNSVTSGSFRLPSVGDTGFPEIQDLTLSPPLPAPSAPPPDQPPEEDDPPSYQSLFGTNI